MITQKWLKTNGAPASFVEWLRWKLERNHVDRMSKTSVMNYLAIDGCVAWQIWLRTATESKIMRRALGKFNRGDKVTFNRNRFTTRNKAINPVRYSRNFWPLLREDSRPGVPRGAIGRIVDLNGIAARVRFERDVKGWGSRNRYQDCDPRDLVKVAKRKRGS